MSSALDAHQAVGFFSDADHQLLGVLSDAGQQHLFSDWPEPGTNDDAKRDQLAALSRANNGYPGGIQAYVHSAKVLLARARAGANPYEGLVPHRPSQVDLSDLGPELRRYEDLGLRHGKGLGMVLVAGGLGERLGYAGIKIDIRVDLTSDLTYLALYGRWLQALGRRTGREHPLVIMTSGDTHAGTLASLERLDWLGMGPDRITLLQQQLVPALADNNARIAMAGPTRTLFKPHGHGDVHLLLHRSGTAPRLADQGITHLAFIQDTNAQVVNSLLPTLGVSIEQNLTFNTVAVPRVAGESVGAMTRLVGPNRELTINVEYNQLDSLLRATVEPRGDVGDEQGLSPFPGNTNTLMIAMQDYLPVLESCGGVVAEFVNPKYSDPDKSVFKKPTRLETMMQDLPKRFESGERVGVTVFDRRWVFSADKNNLTDARAKSALNQPSECAATAEDDWYEQGRRKLALAGAQLEAPQAEIWEGIAVDGGARVSLDPSFALVLNEIRVGQVRLGRRTHLRIEGAVTLSNLTLTGSAALSVFAAPGATIRVDGLVLNRPGQVLCALEEGEYADDLKIRGYELRSENPLTISVESGDWLLGPGGHLSRIDPPVRR
jgi:UDP-sugar pyrophosphorylase